MKKFTFMMALFVCAIGFSQTSSLSEWVEQNPQARTQVQAQTQTQPRTAVTSASALGERNAVFLQEVQSPITLIPNTDGYVRTNFDATSLTSAVVRGTNVNIGEAGTASRAVNAVSITHSNTQTIEAGAEIACASPTSYRNNSIFRDFDLANDFGIAGDFVVTDAEIAIGAGVVTPNGFPLTVNIYSTTTGTFPGGTLTLQGTGSTTITSADSETMISIAVAATIPAGESMIYEVMIVDDGTDTNFMRFGANNDGQTGPSYIMAADCGAPDPIDMAVAFGLTNSFVMNVVGDEATGGGGAACSEENLSNGFENAFTVSSNQAQRIATDITVAMDTDMMLNTVTTNLMVTVGESITGMDVVIYDDAAGSPGTIINTEAGIVPTSQANIGAAFGLDVLEVVVDITPYMLSGQAGAATTYWVVVVPTTNTSGNAFWEGTSATIVGNNSYFATDGVTWNLNTGWDQVYVFEGDCTAIGGGGGDDCSASNPSNGFENGRGNNVENGWTVATDMIVPMGSDMMLTQVTTFQFMSEGGVTVVSADITIYNDNAGVPGATVIASETLAPTSNTVVGNNFGFDISEVVFDIAPVALAGDAAMDMTYWVAVQVTTSDNMLSFWENSTASMIGNPQAFSDDGGATWSIQDAAQESVYVFTADCTAIGGGGVNCDTTVVYDSTAVPFEIDGTETTTDDCAGAPNLIPTSVVDESGIIGTDAEIVGVTIDILHTWSGDLTISLESPTGEVIVLADQLSGNTDDAYNGTVFQDGGADITVAVAPFGVGPYAPQGGDFASAFAGVEINGDWNLVICDAFGGDSGTVLAFSLEICSTSPPPITCVVAEDFDAGLPTGWSTVVNTGTCDWMNGVDLPTGGPLATNAMLFDDDACGSGADASNVSLMSDVYYTDNATFITLTYDYGFQEAGDQMFTVEVYDGAAWQQVAIYEDDAAADLQTETIDVTAYANADFQVRWTYDDIDGSWGWHAVVDNFCLDHDAIEPPPGPDNDLCEDAIAVSCGDTVSGDTTEATNTGNPGNCDTDLSTAPGVWYTLTIPTDGNYDVVVDTFGSDYDTKLGVFSGDCGALVCVAGNDDTGGLQSEVLFEGTSGETYYLYVTGFSTAAGAYDLNIGCTIILSVADNTIEGFSFYPNPSSDVINISAPNNIEQVAIYNILGQKVVDQAVNATSSQVNVADLATGTYIMKATVNGVTASYKVIKN